MKKIYYFLSTTLLFYYSVGTNGGESSICDIRKLTIVKRYFLKGTVIPTSQMILTKNMERCRNNSNKYCSSILLFNYSTQLPQNMFLYDYHNHALYKDSRIEKILNRSKLIWRYNFPDPSLSGTGFGLLNAFQSILLQNNNTFILFIFINNRNQSANLRIVSLKYNDSGIVCGLEENVCNIRGVEYGAGISLYKSDNIFFASFPSKKVPQQTLVRAKFKHYPYYITMVLYISDIPENAYKCSSPLQLVFPFCPSEIVVNDLRFFNLGGTCSVSGYLSKFPYEIIVGNKVIAHKKMFDFWFSGNRNYLFKGMSLDTKSVLESIRLQLFAMTEKEIFKKRIAASGIKITSQDVIQAIDKFCADNKVKLKDVFKVPFSEKELKKKISNDKMVQYNLAVSKWVEKNHRPGKECTVSKQEIADFYKNYKWSYRKADYPKQAGLEKAIIKEIKRLKYYRLDELLTKSPKVEIIWKKPKDSPAN
jgi:hypothetical protein